MSFLLVLGTLLGVVDDPLLVLTAVVLPLVDNSSVVFLVSVDINTLSTESLDVESFLLSLNWNQLENLSGLVLVLGSYDLGLVVRVVSLNGDVVSFLVLDLTLTLAIHLNGELLVVSAVIVP